MMIPEHVDEDGGHAIQFFKRSAFSNLPIIDCEYIPYEFERLNWVDRWMFYSKRFACRSIFFLDTIFHMLQMKDLLYCIINILATWLCYHYRYGAPTNPCTTLRWFAGPDWPLHSSCSLPFSCSWHIFCQRCPDPQLHLDPSRAVP